MIVCSCNVFSDHQLRSVVAKEVRRPRMSEVYACLGCSAQCGRCAHTIKRIMEAGLRTRLRSREDALTWS
jgi:bacterioferritin-associated ferredoxin